MFYFQKEDKKNIFFPTSNVVGSPFLNIGQRSNLTLLVVRFNIVIPWHRW